jgi:hypothetical protein
MVGKLEDFVAKKEAEYPPPELTDFDRLLIGRAVRLEIPFGGRYELRQIAGILRSYAEQIDFWTRQSDLTDRQLLVHLKHEAKMANFKIRELCETSGKGKKPRAYGRQ